MTNPCRWQLNRAGIANVYQYENEVFTFRGGRLLLRGVNGSGKSTAMNMLLPFLLTGKTRGIDAAGEQAGVLKSWMLSGRDEKQPVGYLWLEFALTNLEPADKAAEPQTLTIGCGIKANRSSDTVTTWWFITGRRPGIDFDLVEQQVPLSADALRNVVSPDPVYPQDRRADYRHEVARRLYGGANLDSFLDLINTVRNPRVGDRVDVDLPRYLVAALPNLSETALLEAARPLDDLDEHRRNVGELQATAAGLEAITTVYRNYIATELHREVTDAKKVLSDNRRAQRDSKSAEQYLSEAKAQEQEARETLKSLQWDVQNCLQQIQTLERSAAYTEGQQLEDLRKHVSSLKLRVAEDLQALKKLEARQPDFFASVHRVEKLADERWRALTDELHQLTSELDNAGIKERPAAVIPLARVGLSVEQQHDLPDTLPNEPLEDFNSDAVSAQLKSVSAAAATRILDVNTAQDQLQQVEKATAKLTEAQSAHAQALVFVSEVTNQFESGRTKLEETRSQWIQSAQGWVKSARQEIVNGPTPPGFRKIEATYLNNTTASADLIAQRTALEEGIDETRHSQQKIVLALDAKAKSARQDLATAQTEFDRLNAITEPEIPALTWQQRDELSFADLVDFQDTVSDAQRAGLEAAMEASGLLSATVSVSGDVIANGKLLISTAQNPDSKTLDAEHSLSRLLLTSIPAGCNIDSTLINNILASISTRWADSYPTTVTTDGEFKLGALSGRHSKPEAEYIGASARREKLEKLRRKAQQELQLANDALELLQAQLDEAQAFVAVLAQLRKTLPTLDEVDRAQATAHALEAQLAIARDTLLQKEQAISNAEKLVHTADEELHRLCRTLQLPNDNSGLQRLEKNLQAIKSLTDITERTARSVTQACIEWSHAVDQWRVAQQDLQQARARYTAANAEYQTRQTKLDTLEATLGTEFRAVIEKIDHFTTQKRKSDEALPKASDQCDESIRATQRKAGELDNCRRAERIAEQACVKQQEHLQSLTEVSGLLAAVSLDSDNQVTSLPATTADANGLNQLLTALQTALPAKPADTTSADGVRISLRQRRNMLGAGWDAEDSQPVTDLPMSIIVNGPLGQMPLAESLTSVRTQLTRLQALLTEKQDQALRNLLQGLIAREVAEKMFQAKRLIDGMNDRLGSVTSSHGIGVKLRWRQSRELDENLSSTVKILAKQPDLRSEEEEATLREALANALDEERRLEPDAPYRQLIARVFDYRAWHEMDILLRRGDEPQIRLSRRTPLSEGEKKLVSYLPLFAAVAASCDALAKSGDNSVPRFLLLDDAFAKVSEDNHEPLFGLLVDLDLDFIATSERLWGTHPSVPALAITEVVRDVELGAILLEHSHWDGNTLHMSATIKKEATTHAGNLLEPTTI